MVHERASWRARTCAGEATAGGRGRLSGFEAEASDAGRTETRLGARVSALGSAIASSIDPMHEPGAAFMHSRWIITALMKHSALTRPHAFPLRCAPR